MRLILPVLALIAALLLSRPATAGLDEGLTAYQRHDWIAAAAEFRPLAAGGNAAAQARLGHMLLFGLGVPRDDTEGLKLLNAAAAAGDPLGQHWLGSIHSLGRSVPKDQAAALMWLGRAADQGYPDSLHALGEIYFNGIGITKDEAKAIEFYRRAADKGLPISLEKLAELNWNGRAMPADRAKAVEFARRAAQANRPFAQFILGLALLTGDGTTKDPAQAAMWFRRAADQGFPQAQHNLGAMYANGMGIGKNLAEGYFWLALSAERAPANLKATYEKERETVAALLPPAEAGLIRQKVAAWKPAQPGAPLAATPGATASGPSSSPPPPGQPGRVSMGSGFLVSRDGSVLTNAHVVEQCSGITIQPLDGPPVAATLAAKDAVNDLALLKAGLRTGDIARFRQDRPLRSGDEVVVVGFPLSNLLSREANVTSGVISAMAGIRGDQRHYQITAPVQKGNSGGPLADMSGNVVGIVASKLNAMKIAGQYGDLPQNINFAIKAELARKFLEDHNVGYETAPANRQLSSADVGERIKRVTVFVECKIN